MSSADTQISPGPSRAADGSTVTAATVTGATLPVTQPNVGPDVGLTDEAPDPAPETNYDQRLPQGTNYDPAAPDAADYILPGQVSVAPAPTQCSDAGGRTVADLGITCTHSGDGSKKTAAMTPMEQTAAMLPAAFPLQPTYPDPTPGEEKTDLTVYGPRSVMGCATAHTVIFSLAIVFGLSSMGCFAMGWGACGRVEWNKLLHAIPWNRTTGCRCEDTKSLHQWYGEHNDIEVFVSTITRRYDNEVPSEELGITTAEKAIRVTAMREKVWMLRMQFFLFTALSLCVLRSVLILPYYVYSTLHARVYLSAWTLLAFWSGVGTSTCLAFFCPAEIYFAAGYELSTTVCEFLKCYGSKCRVRQEEVVGWELGLILGTVSILCVWLETATWLALRRRARRNRKAVEEESVRERSQHRIASPQRSTRGTRKGRFKHSAMGSVPDEPSSLRSFRHRRKHSRPSSLSTNDPDSNLPSAPQSAPLVTAPAAPPDFPADDPHNAPT